MRNSPDALALKGSTRVLIRNKCDRFDKKNFVRDLTLMKTVPQAVSTSSNTLEKC